ncbi:hypothetical protein [Kribbella sp. NPDC051770]|uniref:hypothetical protein n=1 Tax=Kribbella sp. NPDC051770 TaxID=3155413 RepID=UPI00342F6BAE
MPVANVSAVTMPDEAVYAYICGEGCLWRYHADGTGDGVRTKLTTSAASPDSDRPVQVVLNRAEGLDQLRHVFYRQPRSDNLWYGVDQIPDGGSGVLVVRQLETGAGPLQVMKTFGAVGLTDGVVLVGATPHQKTSLQIVTIPWAALDQATWMEGTTLRTVPLPLSKDSGDGSLDENDCEVSCDVVLGPDGPALVIIAKRKDGSTWRLGCWTAPIGDGLQIGRLSEHPQRWTGSAIRFPAVQALPDNSALLYFIDHSGTANWYTNTAVRLVGSPTAKPPVPRDDWTKGTGAADPLGIIDQMSKGRSKHVRYGGNAFRVIVGAGRPTSTPSPVNPELEDLVVPLHAGVLYYNGNGRIGEVHDTRTWLTLTRTARPRVPGKQLLLGIIEGPPPIPNENLNMADHYDPLKYFNGPGYALTTYAGTRTRATGMDLTWSAGLVAKTSVKGTAGVGLWKLFEVKAWLKIEASLQAAYKGAYTKIESTQAVATISAGAEIEGDGSELHPYAVQPAGVLVFQNADWTGYEYSYRSADGSSPEGSVAVLQIEPTNVSVISVPYLMNPAHRPVPGMLSSYVLSDDEHQALERRSIIDLGRGTGYLTGSWGYDTKTVATFGTTSSATTKHGFSFELSTLVSAGVEAELLDLKGEAEVGAGVKLALESSWSTTSGDGVQVGSEVWLRGNSKAPNAFVDYSYRMYLLEESSEWTTDLLNGLYTDTFPFDPEERTPAAAARRVDRCGLPTLEGLLLAGHAPLQRAAVRRTGVDTAVAGAPRSRRRRYDVRAVAVARAGRCGGLSGAERSRSATARRRVDRGAGTARGAAAAGR